MRLKQLLFAVTVLTLVIMTSSTLVQAGITGKITGIITDAELNTPLPGVNVILDGTQIGAATDPEGRYLILNVPPGTYTVRASMMGYKEMRVEQIGVRIDLTTTLDMQMQQTVLDVGETITVVAERPLVQRDMTSSLASVGSEEISSLPVESVGDVLELQAGVIRDGGDFHIRGGRANEVTFWVDGVEITDVYSGESMGATIEKDAIQELQVVSGTFNAEYGKAMSGIVNIITKEGSPKYSGKVNAYIGDYYSTDDVYSVLKKIDTTRNASTGVLEEVEDLEDPLAKLNLTLNTDFSLSGPVPFLGDKLTFFTNARYISREGYLYGREWFTAQGFGGDSSLVPMRERYDYSGLGKLTYRISPNLKLSYQIMGNRGHNDRSYSRAFRYVPGGVRQGNSESMTHLLSWIHTLSVNTFYELRLATMSRKNESYLYEDPTKIPHWLVKVASDTTLGIEEMILDPSIDADKVLFESLKLQDASYSWFMDPDNAEGYLHPDSASTPTSFSYYRVGTTNSHSYRDYSFWNAKFDITSQINPRHQLKAGFELKLHELGMDDYTLIAKKVPGKAEDIIPFTPQVPSITSLSRDKYNYKPREFSTYIQDKIELKEMIVNIGLRFDYFDANTTIPADMRDPDIYHPFRNENIYKNWVEPEEPLGPTELAAYKAQFEEYTPEERKAFMRKDVDPKMKISPRIGIAYPITDRGVIHFSYGHFLGMPGLQYLYNDSDYKLQSGGGNRLLGNPDLEPEKTVHYEIGLQQQLGEDLGLDVSLFYKDTRGWVGATPLLKTVRTSVAYSRYRNEDYSNVYGLTLELEKRFARAFSAKLYYTYQLAEGTYSNPSEAYDNVYNSGTPDEPRLALIPMNWDVRQILNAFLTMSQKGWVVTLTGKYQSGQPYTPAISKSEIVGASSYIGWTSNSERKPSISSVDIRVLKNIPIGSLNFQLYTIIYNLFDQRGEQNVYGETGTADYSANLQTDYPGYNPERIGTYNENLRRPEWYQAPREIQLGLAVEF